MVIALPIRLLVALPSEDVPRLSKGLLRTLGEDMNATMLPLADDVLQLVDSMCEALSSWDPHMLISFLPSRRHFYMSMVSGQAGLPVLSLARQYTDKVYKVSTKIYLLLLSNPVITNLRYFDPSVKVFPSISQIIPEIVPRQVIKGLNKLF